MENEGLDALIYAQVVYDSFTSSNIKSFQYFLDEERLAVTFKSDSEYYYFGVPKDIVETWFRASSKGKYHYANIRMNYQYVRRR